MSDMAAVLKAIKDAQAHNIDEIVKNFSQPGSATTGLQGYSLEAPAKQLYPVLTPMRNAISRIGGGRTIQANWKAITAVNTNRVRPGVSEGNRGVRVQHATAEYFAAFRGLGLENMVTFEADYASAGYQDVRALAARQTLEALMIEEEKVLIGGNTSLSMGTTPTPTLAAASGGTISAATQSVICVALGVQAYFDVAGLANGLTNPALDLTTGIVATETRTLADGTTESVSNGVAQKSASATVAVNGSQAINAYVDDVPGAFAYAWYLGEAGSEKLAAVTTVNHVKLTADAAGSAQAASALPAADHSTNSMEFDGLLTMCSKTSLNAYYRVLATGTPGTGTRLSSNSAGGIAEFDTAFAHFYNKYRLSPTTIFMHASNFEDMCKIILDDTKTSPSLTVNFDPNSPMDMMAGRRVGSVANIITGTQVQIVVHPNLPQGTILFYSSGIPAYLQGVTTLLRVLTRQDYYQIEWPLRTRKYEYGVYMDGVLQNYFPPAFGIIKNVAVAA